jgi:hypothetical protein
MASTYANSYFTNIILDGKDSSYGLRGLCTTTEPLRYKQRLLQFPGLVEVVEFLREKNYKPWHKTGWTFQEPGEVWYSKMKPCSGIISALYGGKKWPPSQKESPKPSVSCLVLKTAAWISGLSLRTNNTGI